MRGICPICHQGCVLTRHHIWHKRHRKMFPKKDPKRSEVVLLCRKCHDRVHTKIPSGTNPLKGGENESIDCG